MINFQKDWLISNHNTIYIIVTQVKQALHLEFEIDIEKTLKVSKGRIKCSQQNR